MDDTSFDISIVGNACGTRLTGKPWTEDPMMRQQIYPAAMRGLHWIGALAVVAAVTLGFMQEDAGVSRAALLRAHLVVGAVIVLTTVARLVVRRRSQRPSPLSMPAWRRMLQRAVHGILYVTLLLMGISGIETALLGGLGPILTGATSTVPSLEGVAPASVHATLAFVFLGALVVHVAGVIAYQVRQGDALGRMIGRALPNGGSQHGVVLCR